MPASSPNKQKFHQFDKSKVAETANSACAKESKWHLSLP